MSNPNFIADDEITPRTDEEWAEHVETKKLLAQAALDGTWMGKTSVQIDNEINQVLVEAGIDTSVEPQLSDYDNEDMYWEAHAVWANEQSGETARHQAEVAAILGVEYYGKK